jgi:hypothetical protein
MCRNFYNLLLNIEACRKLTKYSTGSPRNWDYLLYRSEPAWCSGGCQGLWQTGKEGSEEHERDDRWQNECAPSGGISTRASIDVLLVCRRIAEQSAPFGLGNRFKPSIRFGLFGVSKLWFPEIENRSVARRTRNRWIRCRFLRFRFHQTNRNTEKKQSNPRMEHTSFRHHSPSCPARCADARSWGTAGRWLR